MQSCGIALTIAMIKDESRYICLCLFPATQPLLEILVCCLPPLSNETPQSVCVCVLASDGVALGVCCRGKDASAKQESWQWENDQPELSVYLMSVRSGANPVSSNSGGKLVLSRVTLTRPMPPGTWQCTWQCTACSYPLPLPNIFFHVSLSRFPPHPPCPKEKKWFLLLITNSALTELKASDCSAKKLQLQ